MMVIRPLIFNHLLYFARFCAGSSPKIANKDIQQKNFARFHKYFPLLAKVEPKLYPVQARDAIYWLRNPISPNFSRLCFLTKFSVSTKFLIHQLVPPVEVPLKLPVYYYLLCFSGIR